MKKICSKCGEEKEHTEFRFRRDKATKSRLRRKDCAECQRLAGRSHYSTNKAAYKTRSQRRREDLRRRHDEIKAKLPCADCQLFWHPCQTDWDHRDGATKIADVSFLVNAFYWSEALEEMKKCDLVCANCHRMRTWLRAHDLPITWSGRHDSNVRLPRSERGSLPTELRPDELGNSVVAQVESFP